MAEIHVLLEWLQHCDMAGILLLLKIAAPAACCRNTPIAVAVATLRYGRNTPLAKAVAVVQYGRNTPFPIAVAAL